jgi:hypothetical protein
VHARSRYAVTTAEQAINDAIQAWEINRELANHIRQQIGLPPIEPHNLQVKGSAFANRAREEDHATEQPRSNRRRPELAPDLTEEFEDEANRLPDSRRASPSHRRTDTFSRVTDTTQALLNEFEEEGARAEYE